MSNSTRLLIWIGLGWLAYRIWLGQPQQAPDTGANGKLGGMEWVNYVCQYCGHPFRYQIVIGGWNKVPVICPWCGKEVGKLGIGITEKL